MKKPRSYRNCPAAFLPEVIASSPIARRPSLFTLLPLLSSLLLIAAGCGGESYPVAPVSGQVTLDGQPLADARIGFEPRRQGNNPNAGPGSYAKTDAQGMFELQTLNDEKGAVVTTHDVWIRTFVAPADRSGEIIESQPEKVPARYNDATTLSFTVPAEGSDQANFALTSEP